MRLIDADKTYEVLTDHYHQRTELQHMALKEALNRVPTVEPVKHGRWEWIGGYGPQYRCSECIMCAERRTKYCPYCGAKMDKEEGEEA